MFAKAVSPLAFLLIAPHDPAILSDHSCLSQSYYGQYGHQSVFIVDEPCFSSSSNLFDAGSVVSLDDTQRRQLVWLEHEAINDSIKPASFVDETAKFIAELQRPMFELDSGAQQAIGDRQGPLIMSLTSSSMLISVSSEMAISLDTRLPRFWKSTPLPSSPVPYMPVPSTAVENVKKLLASVKFDPIIASTVGDLSISQLRKDVRYLTGEDPSSDLVSRISFSQGAFDAADWLKEQFESTGASCKLKPFLNGFAPNVICTYEATEDTTETILLSAHYDSAGTFASERAPGGNDDGSGTATLLSIARMIARKGVTFRKNVQLCAFAGEEQGLYGSKAYARELRAANANLTLMVQADMIAYHAAGEPAQMGLSQMFGTPEVNQLVANLSAIYSPELTVGFTPVCCSDHQSFHEQGYPATMLFERAGPVADPLYHNDGDFSDRDGYDFEQVRSIAKVQFATLLHAAGFDVSNN